MIYRIYKETGRIGTGIEKTDGSFTVASLKEMKEATGAGKNQISLAAFDDQTNTVHIFNDQVIDVSSIVQKFKNYGDLPNKHEFTIHHK